MRRLAAILALMAAPAFATVDGWPALYDVAGVPADDVLNLRARPDPHSPVIGTLAPDARGVEVIRTDPRQRWGLVNTGDTAGWASLTFLARRSGQWDGAIPARLYCAGTEPFWAMSLTPDGMRIRRADEGDRDLEPLRREPAQARRDKWAFFAGDRDRAVTGIVTVAACTDGMSHREYGLAVDLIETAAGTMRVTTGCCSLAPPAAD
ncbi:MAG: SH3 domain-containing protein [Tranquillimonas sp.]